LTVKVNEHECELARVDPARVQALAMALERAGTEARKLGMVLVAAAGTEIAVRFAQRHPEGRLVLARANGPFEGDDGTTHPDRHGLERDESTGP
jgi:hypothetical protein